MDARGFERRVDVYRRDRGGFVKVFEWVVEGGIEKRFDAIGDHFKIAWIEHEACGIAVFEEDFLGDGERHTMRHLVLGGNAEFCRWGFWGFPT